MCELDCSSWSGAGTYKISAKGGSLSLCTHAFCCKVNRGNSVMYEFSSISWKIAGAKVHWSRSPTVHLLGNFDNALCIF